MSRSFKKFKNKSGKSLKSNSSKKTTSSPAEKYGVSVPNVVDCFRSEFKLFIDKMASESYTNLLARKNESEILFHFNRDKLILLISYTGKTNHKTSNKNKQKNNLSYSKIEVFIDSGEINIFKNNSEDLDLSNAAILLLYALLHNKKEEWMPRSFDFENVAKVIQSQLNLILREVSSQNPPVIELESIFYFTSERYNKYSNKELEKLGLPLIKTDSWKMVTQYFQTFEDLDYNNDSQESSFLFYAPIVLGDLHLDQNFNQFAYNLNYSQSPYAYYGNHEGIAHDIVFLFSDQTALSLSTLVVHPYSAFCKNLIFALARGVGKLDKVISECLIDLSSSYVDSLVRNKLTAFFTEIFNQQNSETSFHLILEGRNPLNNNHHSSFYHRNAYHQAKQKSFQSLPIRQLNFDQEMDCEWMLTNSDVFMGEQGEFNKPSFCIVPMAKECKLKKEKDKFNIERPFFDLKRYEASRFLEIRKGTYYDTVSKRIGKSKFLDQYHHWLKTDFSQKRVWNNSHGERYTYFELSRDLDLHLLQFSIEQFERYFHQSLKISLPQLNLSALKIYLDFASENLDSMSINLDVENANLLSTDGISPIVSMKDCFSYLSDNLGRLSEFFQSGLGGFFYSDNRDLVPAKRGDVRQNCLKLLRHSGLAKMLFLVSYEELRDCTKLEKSKINELVLECKRTALKLLLPSNKVPFDEITLIDEDTTGDIKKKNSQVKQLFKLNFGTKLDRLLVSFLKQLISAPSEFDLVKKNEQLYKLPVRELDRLYMDQIFNFLKSTTDHQIFQKQKSKHHNLIYNYSSLKDYERYDYENDDSFESNILKIDFKGKEIDPFSFKIEAPNLFLQTLSVNDEDLRGAILRFNQKEIKKLLPNEFSALISLTQNSDSSVSIDTDKSGEKTATLDWFEMHPEIFFDGQKVTNLNDINRHGTHCLEYNGQFYRIPQQSLPIVKWLNYFWQKVQGQKKSNKLNKFESDIYHLPKSLALDLLAMKQAGIEIKGGRIWEEIEAELEVLKNNELGKQQYDFLFTSDFSIPLKHFQKEGTAWLYQLYKLKMGGILADDMGLGKTIQMIGLFEVLRQKNQMGHNLVVVPTSLTYNWVEEIKKFASHLSVFNFSSGDKKEHLDFLHQQKDTITIITYGLLTRNMAHFEDQNINWNLLVLDEAQNIKNITANRTKAARKFKAQVKICLTGTPMENHYGELFSLIDLVVPGVLGPYLEFMKKLKFNATKSEDLASIQQEIDFLKMKIAPLVLRREKSKILDELPDKTETTLHFAFDKQQEKIYKDVATAWNKKILEVVEEKGAAKSRLEVLTAILRLRQVCSLPSSLPDIEYKQTPPKIFALTEQLEELFMAGHKSLVFTNFTSTLFAIEKILREKKIPAFTIHGGTAKKTREQRISSFSNHPHGAVMLMTLKTGGVGLNLTCANYVFHIEPWWNPAVENQATDRAHRMGQKNKVHVYRYIMQNSIEEKMMALKDRKKMAIDSLFQEDANNPMIGKSSVSYDDFLNLV